MLTHLVVAVVLMVSVVGATGMSALADGPADQKAGVAEPTAAQVVTLVTGDAVRVASTGVAVIPAQRTGIAGDIQTMRLGTSVYVIPAAARPYVGRYLDFELFDVTALAAAPRAQRTQLRMTIQRGASVDVPGVTVTGRSGGTVTGYLTAAGMDTFRHALVAQWTFDARHGWPAQSALFAGITSIAPAGSTTPPPERAGPLFRQVTLSVRVLDSRGSPVPFTLVGLMNTDDARRYLAFPVVVNGLAKVSVPVGDYSAIATVDEYDPHSQARLDSRIVIATDYRVGGAGQTLVLDARTATTQPSIRTPRPSGRQLLLLDWARLDEHGATGLSSLTGYDDPQTKVYVTPTSAARVGEQHWVTTWMLTGAPPKGIPYVYDLVFDDPLVRSDQARMVRLEQLSLVHARYYTDGQPHISLFARGPVLPYEGGYQLFLEPLAAPQVRTEYVLSPTGDRWASVLIGDADTSTTAVSDGLRRFPPDTTSSAVWLRPALMPGFAAPTAVDQDFACPACRVGNTMVFRLSAVTDSNPSHTGSLDEPPDGTRTARLRLYQDGTLVTDVPNTTTAEVPVAGPAATYRLLFQLDRSATGARLSTSTRTAITFASAAEQGPPAPPTWICAGGQLRRDPACRVLPLLQVRAPLPVDLTGHLAWGTHQLNVEVGHAPGAQPTRITTLVIETSTDGIIWKRVKVTRQSDGHYRALLSGGHATAGRSVDLRITTHDAAGGTLQQTIRDAYTVSQS